MLVVLCLVALVLKLVAVLLAKNNDYEPEKEMTPKQFDRVISMIIVVFNTMVTLAFIPNFAMIMRKLKKDYNHVYISIRYRILTLFFFIIVFLIMRLVIYIYLRLYHSLLAYITIRD